jgi:aminopeptidase N
MENIACVTHNERMIFRSKVTEALRMYRAEVILHEMAHMWFGNLVSMKWWDDIWLNESFAEYMGYLGTAEATRFKVAWTEFANDTKAAARRQDQLPTTHPIVADIPDVESITLNLDRITYNKGAAAVQQLVTWIGADTFFRGLHAYFTVHAYENTDLADFLAALEKASGRDLKTWSQAWLETAGVNTLAAVLDVDDGEIRSAALNQLAPADHPTLRPHRLRIGLFDLEGGRLKRRRGIELDIVGPVTAIPLVAGERAPDLVLVNDQDLTYCKVALDHRSLDTLRRHLSDLDDPLARALAWGALWDMTRDAELRARDYIALSLDHAPAEEEASTLESLMVRTERSVDSFSDPAHRPAVRSMLAQVAKEHLQSSEPGGDAQLLWVLTFIEAARALPDVAWVLGLLKGKTRLKGLAIDFNVRLERREGVGGHRRRRREADRAGAGTRPDRRRPEGGGSRARRASAAFGEAAGMGGRDQRRRAVTEHEARDRAGLPPRRSREPAECLRQAVLRQPHAGVGIARLGGGDHHRPIDVPEGGDHARSRRHDRGGAVTSSAWAAATRSARVSGRDQARATRAGIR